MNFNKLPLVLIGTFTLSSCSSISHTLIAPEVDSPVMASAGVVDLLVHTVPGREATLFRDASYRPPTYSTDFMAGQSKGGALVGGLGYALEGISFSGGLLGANSLVEGVWLGGKIQLLGRQAIAGNMPFYLAGWGRIGGQHATKDGAQNGEFGPGGYPWEASRNGSFFNVGLSLGYELAPGFVPFIGYGKGSASGSATVDQKISTDGLTPAASYTNSFNASVSTLGGGIQFVGNAGRFTVNLQNTWTEVSGVTVTGQTFGFALEFKIKGPSKEATTASGT